MLTIALRNNIMYNKSNIEHKKRIAVKAAFVVEFKIAKSIQELEDKAKEAIQQIKDRNYMKELKDNGYEVVHKYGIAFFGKDCHVLFEE